MDEPVYTERVLLRRLVRAAIVYRRTDMSRSSRHTLESKRQFECAVDAFLSAGADAMIKLCETDNG